MPTNILEAAAAAFADLIEQTEISLVEEHNEVHIIDDDWTLVVQGEQPAGVMIALDDESGDPGEMLAAAINVSERAGLQAFDAATNGEIANLLASSPDPLAQALATLLRG